MIYVIFAAVVLHSISMIGLGGWLHYRFGSTVVNTARVLEAAVLASNVTAAPKK